MSLALNSPFNNLVMTLPNELQGLFALSENGVRWEYESSLISDRFKCHRSRAAACRA
jgi:hypothetical protein